MQKCRVCEKELELSNYRNSTVKGKIYYRKECKKCAAEAQRERYKNFTPEQIERKNQQNRESYFRNIKTSKKYREQNKEKRAVQNKEWTKKNRGRKAYINSVHRARALNAMPPWLTEQDKDIMRQFYVKMSQMNEEVGFRKYVVDHIHPLESRSCCGLHVPWNLQIITLAENSKKRNSVEGENVRHGMAKYVISSEGLIYASAAECARELKIGKTSINRYIKNKTPVNGVTYRIATEEENKLTLEQLKGHLKCQK